MRAIPGQETKARTNARPDRSRRVERGDQDQQGQSGDGEEDVDEPHDDGVDFPPRVPGEESDRAAEEEGGEGREHGDHDRDAPAKRQSRQNVAAVAIAAEDVAVGHRRLQLVGEVVLLGREASHVGRDQPRAEDEDDDQAEHHQRRHRHVVGAEAVPGARVESRRLAQGAAIEHAVVRLGGGVRGEGRRPSKRRGACRRIGRRRELIIAFLLVGCDVDHLRRHPPAGCVDREPRRARPR